MDKHVFAKFGVFVLIGLNVGGYYVFWPQQNGGAGNDEVSHKKEDKGEVKLVPARPASPKPKELAAKPAADAIPLGAPVSPRPPEKAKEPDDVVGKLLSRIKEQNEEAKDKPVVTLIPSPMPKPMDEKKLELPELPELPPAPKILDNGKPKPLPPLQGIPVVPARSDSNSGVALPLTSKMSSGPWTLTTEPAGPRTLLIAKLQANMRVIEFRILCDRVEAKPGAHEVLALGNVTLTGADMRVECRRLTVPLKETRLAFEEEVAVTQANKEGVWRAELLVWENPTPVLILNGNAKPGTLALPK